MATAGTYTLYLVPQSGSGTFHIQALSNYVTGSMTVDGAALTLTIPSTASGQRVAVSFTATAGQAVYFNLTHGANTQSAFGATPSLTGPNGPIPLPITGAALYGSTNLEPPIGLTRTGTYTLYLNTPADGYEPSHSKPSVHTSRVR